MRNILYIILLSTFVIFSCTKNEIIEENANSFSILAYDAEISETIGLNIEGNDALAVIALAKLPFSNT